MPTLPTYTKCNSLGCKNNKARYGGYCLDHGGRDTATYKHGNPEQRQERNKMYSNAAWLRQRQATLSQHPLCQACLCRNVVTQASQVDHVFPWTHIGKHAFKYNLFQALCLECHTHKTALEQRGIYQSYSNGVITEFSVKDYDRICPSV